MNIIIRVAQLRTYDYNKQILVYSIAIYQFTKTSVWHCGSSNLLENVKTQAPGNNTLEFHSTLHVPEHEEK